MSTELATVNSMQSYVFANASAFEDAQRMATALSKSTLVPKDYQSNMPNALIALEVAHRIGASPLMVMQNLYIVHGKPSWSSQFIIAAVNSCGRFKPLRFELTGDEGTDQRRCVAWTIEKDSTLPADVRTLADAKARNISILESPPITIDIAKKEGWYGKNGSKWQTMPELMLRYRAASFFGKLYAPEILMGMQTMEESEDVGQPIDVTPTMESKGGNEGLKEKLAKKKAEKQDPIPQNTASNDEEKQEVAAVAELVTVEGEVKIFPAEIDIIALMQMLQSMSDDQRVIFIDDNNKEWPQVIAYMKAAGKPYAAENLQKLVDKK
jgi:hypothetical protein